MPVMVLGMSHRHHTSLRSELFDGDIRLTEDIARKHYKSSDIERLVKEGKIVGGKEVAADGRNLAIVETGHWRVHRSDDDSHWEIPYAMDEFHTDFDGQTYTNSHTDEEKRFIHSAIVGMNEKMSAVKFVNRTNEVHYVSIGYYMDGCWSWVGRVPSTVSPQGLNLQSPCVTVDTIEHELLHTLGKFHEQSRTDRDDHVTINFDNIDPSNHDQFTKQENSDTMGVEYDYTSVMHYWKRAFAVDGAIDTIITSDPAFQNIIGFVDEASKSDLFQIELLYRCPSGPRNYSEFCSTDCLCGENEGECTADDQCSGVLICNDASLVATNDKIDNPTRVCTDPALSLAPTSSPTPEPTQSPTSPTPTATPTVLPTTSPSISSPSPTDSPSGSPSSSPSRSPSSSPSGPPSDRIVLSTLGWVGVSIGATAGATMLVIPLILIIV